MIIPSICITHYTFQSSAFMARWDSLTLHSEFKSMSNRILVPSEWKKSREPSVQERGGEVELETRQGSPEAGQPPQHSRFPPGSGSITVQVGVQ